jgi:hypothetical protein
MTRLRPLLVATDAYHTSKSAARSRGHSSGAYVNRTVRPPRSTVIDCDDPA